MTGPGSTLGHSQTTDPFDYFLFFVVSGWSRGHGHPRKDRSTSVLGAATLCPIGVPVGFDMHDIDLTELRLPIERLEQTAEEIFGMPRIRAAVRRLDSGLIGDAPLLAGGRHPYQWCPDGPALSAGTSTECMFPWRGCRAARLRSVRVLSLRATACDFSMPADEGGCDRVDDGRRRHERTAAVGRLGEPERSEAC